MLGKAAALSRGCFLLLIPVWVKSGSDFLERPRVVELHGDGFTRLRVRCAGWKQSTGLFPRAGF